MAVLKDLIVHGPSRFINTAQFEALKANRIGAEEGVFNKLIATNADIGTLDVDDLTAQNATVVGLLDVQGEMHTNSWTNANIANIGGSFYIAPTIIPTDGTTTISITKNSATSWTVVLAGTFATDFIKTGTNTTGQNWPANSLVLITGNITVKDMKYPLGTLKGTLSTAVTASAASTSKTVTITGVTDGQGNTTPAVLDELWTLNGANISNAAFSDGKISLYKMGSFPIGIQMSSMGTNANSMIEIYGGVAANPTVRIGHLAGLPTINGTSPTGWGIYTDNGYFSGVIVSSSGKIGGFTIGSTDLYNGTLGAANSVWMSTGTSSSANIGGSGSISGWAFTAGTTYGVTKGGALYATSGKIGNFTLDTSLRDKKTSYNETTNDGIFLGTTGIGLGKGVFSVSPTGYLTAKSGSIAGWTFNTTSLYKNNATPGASSTALVISTGKSSSNSIAGSSGTNTWMLSAGTDFGVTTSGVLYASGAKIAGDVTVSKLTVDSGATISDTNGLISNNAIKIGGRNLLKLSDSLSTDNCWTVESGTIEDGIAKLNDVNNARIYQLPANGYWTWTANTVYTVSVEARTSATGAIHITPVGCGGVASETFTLSTEWKRYSHTFSSATVGTGSLSIYRNAGSVELRKPKLELGNKATDWTPAPEDTDASIEDVANSAAEALASTSDSIYERINNTDNEVAAIQTDLAKTAARTDLNAIDTFVRKYLGENGYVKINNQGLVITQGQFSVVITGDRMIFQENGNSVAYLTNQKLFITKSEVTQEMKIANFIWSNRNGRLTLMLAE